MPRPRLFERLTLQPGQRLILLSATAGFGKTTLLSAWLAQSGLPHAWLALDENDNELITFLLYLVAGIQTIFPQALTETLAFLNAPLLPPLTVLANSLINELDDLDEAFILVLDDYHAIDSMAIHEFVTELITHCPRTLHLVIATRYDPPLPLGRLTARHQLVELRTEDLRFSPPESRALIYAVLGVDTAEQIVGTLTERVEGWVAGLRLLMASLRLHGDAAELEAIVPHRDRLLIDYLANEVFAHLSPSIQKFMLEISILERFNPSLCQAVTGMDSSRSNLQLLQDNELFVVPLDNAGEWFRFHNLFQEFLHARLTAMQSTKEIALLHLRASQWFAAQNLVEDALHHALAARDTNLVAQIIEEYRYVLLNESRIPRLGSWLQLLPPAVIEEHPALLLSRAWIAWFRMQSSEVLALVNRAEIVVQAMPADAAHKQTLLGEVAAIRCYQYYWTGDFAQAQTHAQFALDHTAPDFLHARAQARLFLSASWQAQGNMSEAVRVIEDGLNETESHRLSQLRNLLTALFIQWVNADLERIRNTALSMLDLNDREYSQMHLWANYFLGTMHYQRNELSEAKHSLSTVVEQRHLAHLNALTNGAFALALVYQAENEPEQALATIETLRSFLAESGNLSMLPLAQAYQVELVLKQGRATETAQWNSSAAKTALTPTPNFYIPSLTLPKVLLAQNTEASRRTARELLSELAQYNERTHNVYALIQIFALQALLDQTEGAREDALAGLERAIRLAAPGGLVRVFVDLGPAMGDLFRQLHHRNVARPYIEHVLAALHPLKTAAKNLNPVAFAEPLTERESRILELMAQGLSNKEIAAHEILTLGTVKQYIVHIYQKLLVTNRREALAKARALGLLSADKEHH